VAHAIAACMTTDPRQLLGKTGEDLACTELLHRGYAILARRYRTRYGEIDIVARDNETIVFVEVKARLGDEFGGGAEAITRWKQRRVAQMAVDYLARHRLQNCPCRFDAAIVDFEPAGGRVTMYPNAFDGM